MSDTVIRVENLSKRYRIGLKEEMHDTLVGALADFVKSPVKNLRRLRRLSTFREEGHDAEDIIWALKDASFEVQRGEVVGIIGRNGAGKTTLLKVLSRITHPTSGRVEIRGRVSSLLEVGTGFHKELTGRENVYLNGAILGMKKDEIDRKFDEIVDFSGIEKFIDTPVKYYSSGMYVRLAFAVAAHLEPEILLVDEVLAVGDAAFQKKCLGKMGDVAKEGRTVLFVSHNMIAVQSLCERTIWLNDGKIVEDGQSGQVVSSYLQTSFSTLTEQVWDDVATAPGNDKVRIRRACVRPTNGSPPDPITIRTPLVLEFEYWNLEPGAHLNLSLSLFNENGVEVFATGPVHEPVWHGRPFPAGLFRSACHVPGDLLNDGTYRVVLRVVNQGRGVFRYGDILSFEVRDAVEMRGSWYGKWPGAVRPDLEWSTELVEADELPALSVR
jgi:lipopolysaccharide transport system ATP-binding protein